MCRICGCDANHDHAHSHDHDHGHGHHHDHDHSISHVRRRIAFEVDLLAKNDLLASELRSRLTRDRVTSLNLIGTPGAGKTTLLEQTIRRLTPELEIAVLEGDQATDHDARRIAATGCRVVQINTGAGCHLDASMVNAGITELAPASGSLVIVENVGNLVCPALFDVGEVAKIVAMSVTEGEDKPLKYPHVFRAATVMVLTKVDLLPHLDVDPRHFIANARRVNPELRVFPVAATRGDGMSEWCDWLRAQMRRTP